MRRSSLIYRGLCAVLAFVIAALSLTSCGSAQSRVATDDMRLKVAMNSLSSGYLADLVAADQGYFKAQGLTAYPEETGWKWLLRKVSL